MERGGTQGIQFIVQIVLARLLPPEDYGILALVLIFIELANVFVQSGFNIALIQKKDADDIDFSSAFFLSLLVAILLCGLLFFVSPFISDFYQNEQLESVLRILSITLVLGAINSIQNAYIARNMLFRKLFFSSLGSTAISGLMGIIAAYTGLGVWSLVIQQLSNQLLITIILWFTVKWRPVLIFSSKKIKDLFSYGSKLLVSSMLDILYKDIRSLIIGRIYNSAMLGFYNRGEQLPKLIVSNINGSIQSVMLPTFSACQDDRARVKELVKRSIATSSFIMFPMMIGLAVIAELTVKILLTDKWLPSVPFMQIFCISYALWPIHTANLQAINALGRSDIFLKLEIIKKTIGFIILGISIPLGIRAMAWGALLSDIISIFVNAYPNSKLLNYSYVEQLKDIIPTLIISLAMGAIVYSLSFLDVGVWQQLILQIFTGIVVYFGLAKVFKIESYSYIQSTFKNLSRDRNFR